MFMYTKCPLYEAVECSQICDSHSHFLDCYAKCQGLSMVINAMSLFLVAYSSNRPFYGQERLYCFGFMPM